MTPYGRRRQAERRQPPGLTLAAVMREGQSGSASPGSITLSPDDSAGMPHGTGAPTRRGLYVLLGVIAFVLLLAGLHLAGVVGTTHR